MIKIFDVETFQPFDWIEHYEALCLKMSPDKKCQVLFEKNYAIVPLGWVDSMTKLLILEIPHFANNRLVALKSGCQKKPEQQSNSEFKQALLTLTGNMIKSLFDVVVKHLSQRIVKDMKLTKYDHIRQLMAEIVADLEMAQFILQPKQDDYIHSHRTICILFESALLKLMKLPGGRAFLQGSVLELLFTLRAFKNVYYTC